MSAAITSNPLEEKIYRNIQKHGPMSFAKFMRYALYDPYYGYYKNQDPTFGSQGDFITAPMLGNLFARTLAIQLSEILPVCEQPIISEIGAGNGQLAFDILTELKHLDVPLQEYQIFETSQTLVEQQKIKLNNFSNIKWLKSWNKEDKFEGCIIANEVADALPTHRFLIENGNVFSYGVGQKNGALCYQKIIPPSSFSKEVLSSLDIQSLPSIFISEYCFLLKPWIRMLLTRLSKGAVFIFDYGFPRSEFYHPQRDHGTLMCHYKHTNSDDPFANIGKQDITSHVDFSLLVDAIENTDFDFAGYTSFAGFLTNLGIDKFLPRQMSDMQQIATLQKEIFTLISPAEMGEIFKALAITKSIDFDLQGFHGFCRSL